MNVFVEINVLNKLTGKNVKFHVIKNCFAYAMPCRSESRRKAVVVRYCYHSGGGDGCVHVGVRSIGFLLFYGILGYITN